MKQLLFTFAFVFTLISGATGVSQDSSVKVPTLKQNMKQVGAHLKAISRSVSDASKNADNAAAAQLMVDLFHVIDSQTPHFIDSIPEEQRPAALARYHELIQECMTLSSQLADAFVKSDNASAAALVEKLLELKELGHETFDP